MSDVVRVWLILAAILLGGVLWAWLYLWAPCSALGWMTIKELPARCLP